MQRGAMAPALRPELALDKVGLTVSAARVGLESNG